MPTSTKIDHFIQRWQKATGSERANHQLFVAELCDLLDLPRPDPASDDNTQNSYVFERLVTFHNPDGTSNRGFIDCYRRNCFILEAKHTGKKIGSGVWDEAMLRAQGQGVAYARALSKEEGRPPFVITLDVGVALELYSEFSQSGGAYIPYPDPRATVFNWPTSKRKPSENGYAKSGQTPCHSTPHASPPKSPEKSPASLPLWQKALNRAATQQPTPAHS